MADETLFEKFIRITMLNVHARALLKEFVRVYGFSTDGAVAVAEREAALLRLHQMVQEELNAPPMFVRMPRRRWWAGILVERLHKHRSL